MISIRIAAAANTTKSGSGISKKRIALAAIQNHENAKVSPAIRPFIHGKKGGQCRLVAPSGSPYKSAARDKHGLYEGRFSLGSGFFRSQLPSSIG